MRHYVRYGAGAAAAGIVLRLVVYFSGYSQNLSVDQGVMFTNLFFILAAVFLTVYSVLNDDPGIGAVSHWQEAMKAAAVFAIISSVYTYVHFRFVDTEFLAHRITDRMTAAEQVDFETLKANPHQLTREEFLKKERDMVTFIYSPFTHSSFVLFGYLVLGAIYALLLTPGLRKLREVTGNGK